MIARDQVIHQVTFFVSSAPFTQRDQADKTDREY